MAIVDEKPDSRSGTDGESYRFVFTVLEEDDPTAAIAAVLAEVPLTFDGLVLQRCTYQEIAEEHYEVTVPYGKAQEEEEQATGSVTRDFQIALESAHIVRSRATINSYAKSGSTAPNYKQAINVQKDGTVEGTDVLVPTYGFGVTIRPENSAVTEAYRLLAAQLVGMVNLTEFEGFDPGQVLFAGASGGERNPEDSELRLEFLVRRNETSLTIGEIEDIEKDGWDYLWCLYDKKEEGAGDDKRIVLDPVAVYVEEIFPRGDLTVLYI